MSLTDADRNVIARARALADARTTDALRRIAGSDPDADWATVRAEALGAARYLLGEMAAIIDRPMSESDRDLIARARELGPSLRASASDRDRLAGWLLAELVSLAGRLGGGTDG